MSESKYFQLCESFAKEILQDNENFFAPNKKIDKFFKNLGIIFPSTDDVIKLMQRKLFKLNTVHYFVDNRKKFIWAKMKFDL
jgi:mannitol-1-phosphate/altronate dehydrogenase